MYSSAKNYKMLALMNSNSFVHLTKDMGNKMLVDIRGLVRDCKITYRNDQTEEEEREHLRRILEDPEEITSSYNTQKAVQKSHQLRMKNLKSKWTVEHNDNDNDSQSQNEVCIIDSQGDNDAIDSYVPQLPSQVELLIINNQSISGSSSNICSLLLSSYDYIINTMTKNISEKEFYVDEAQKLRKNISKFFKIIENISKIFLKLVSNEIYENENGNSNSLNEMNEETGPGPGSLSRNYNDLDFSKIYEKLKMVRFVAITLGKLKTIRTPKDLPLRNIEKYKDYVIKGKYHRGADVYTDTFGLNNTDKKKNMAFYVVQKYLPEPCFPVTSHLIEFCLSRILKNDKNSSYVDTNPVVRELKLPGAKTRCKYYEIPDDILDEYDRNDYDDVDLSDEEKDTSNHVDLDDSEESFTITNNENLSADEEEDSENEDENANEVYTTNLSAKQIIKNLDQTNLTVGQITDSSYYINYPLFTGFHFSVLDAYLLFTQQKSLPTISEPTSHPTFRKVAKHIIKHYKKAFDVEPDGSLSFDSRTYRGNAKSRTHLSVFNQKKYNRSVRASSLGLYFLVSSGRFAPRHFQPKVPRHLSVIGNDKLLREVSDDDSSNSSNTSINSASTQNSSSTSIDPLEENFTFSNPIAPRIEINTVLGNGDDVFEGLPDNEKAHFLTITPREHRMIKRLNPDPPSLQGTSANGNQVSRPLNSNSVNSYNKIINAFYDELEKQTKIIRNTFTFSASFGISLDQINFCYTNSNLDGKALLKQVSSSLSKIFENLNEEYNHNLSTGKNKTIDGLREKTFMSMRVDSILDFCGALWDVIRSKRRDQNQNEDQDQNQTILEFQTNKSLLIFYNKVDKLEPLIKSVYDLIESKVNNQQSIEEDMALYNCQAKNLTEFEIEKNRIFYNFGGDLVSSRLRLMSNEFKRKATVTDSSGQSSETLNGLDSLDFSVSELTSSASHLSLSKQESSEVNFFR